MSLVLRSRKAVCENRAHQLSLRRIDGVDMSADPIIDDDGGACGRGCSTERWGVILEELGRGGVELAR